MESKKVNGILASNVRHVMQQSISHMIHQKEWLKLLHMLIQLLSLPVQRVIRLINMIGPT